MTGTHRLEIMRRLRAQAKRHDEHNDETMRLQTVATYQELATDAEWKRRPSYMRGALGTTGVYVRE